MKISVLAVLLALGCGSSKEAAPTAGSSATVERPTVTDPIGFCARARMLVLGRQKCFPEDTSLKMGLDEIAELEAKAPPAGEPRRKVAADCAVMLDSMMRVHQPKNCPLDVTDDERSELTAFLTAWYGERTAVPATLDADATAAMTKVAAHRDAACACATGDCARKAIKDLDGAIAKLPAETANAGDGAAAKMSNEATRCKQKLVYGAPAP